MVNRRVRTAVAVVVPLVVLVAGHWYDSQVLADFQGEAARSFNAGPLGGGLTMAYLGAGAGSIAIFLAAWWSRSIPVAVMYVAGGGFLALLPALALNAAIGPNGAAPLLPEPVAQFVNDQFFGGAGAGAVGLVMTFGGAMFAAGLAVLGARYRPTASAAAASAATAPASPEVIRVTE